MAPALLVGLVPGVKAFGVEFSAGEEVERGLRVRQRFGVAQTRGENLQRIAERFILPAPTHHQRVTIRILAIAAYAALVEPARLCVTVLGAHDVANARQASQIERAVELERGARGPFEARTGRGNGNGLEVERLLDDGAGGDVQIRVVVWREAILISLDVAALAVDGAGAGIEHRLHGVLFRDGAEAPPLIGQIGVAHGRRQRMQGEAAQTACAARLQIRVGHRVAMLFEQRLIAGCAVPHRHAATLRTRRIAVVEHAGQQHGLPRGRGLEAHGQRHVRRRGRTPILVAARHFHHAVARAIGITKQPGARRRPSVRRGRWSRHRLAPCAWARHVATP